MTREEAKQALDWFRNRSKAVTMPGAKRMYLLAIEALSADGDTISRQAAIDAADEECCEFRGIFARIKERINAIPSAQPERKTGRWIWVQYDANPNIGNFHCSVCGFIPATYNSVTKQMKFCPNCGAKMEVDR